MQSRKLSLRAEALTELTPDDLRTVAGASGMTCYTACDSDFQQCLTGLDCIRERISDLAC